MNELVNVLMLSCTSAGTRSLTHMIFMVFSSFKHWFLLTSLNPAESPDPEDYSAPPSCSVNPRDSLASHHPKPSCGFHSFTSTCITVHKTGKKETLLHPQEKKHKMEYGPCYIRGENYDILFPPPKCLNPQDVLHRVHIGRWCLVHQGCSYM